MKAVLIGAGNVAWHLAPALQKAGLEWVQVYSRTEAHAREMAQHMEGRQPTCTTREEDINPKADFYLFAVKDETLPELSSRLRFPNAVAVHVSGSVPLETLQQVSARCGVLYPFQTFSKAAPCPDLKETPFCIEASDNDTLQILHTLAGKISDTVCEMNSSGRAVLHLGGVFACNYTNFMYKAAYDLLQEADVDFKLLLPLIRQTAAKQDGRDPALLQTGPAVRNDLGILEKHTAYLSSTPERKTYLELYKKIAGAIRNK